MIDQGGQTPQQNQSAEKKKSSPVLLIILLVILGIAGVGLAIDYKARTASAAAADAVTDALNDKEKSNQPLTKDEVHKLIDIEPVAGENDNSETYYWRGALKKYKVILKYSGGTTLERVEQDFESAF